MPPVTVMLTRATLATCIMSKRMAGHSLVRLHAGASARLLTAHQETTISRNCTTMVLGTYLAQRVMDTDIARERMGRVRQTTLLLVREMLPLLVYKHRISYRNQDVAVIVRRTRQGLMRNAKRQQATKVDLGLRALIGDDPLESHGGRRSSSCCCSP